jgi:hypothetical protein
MSLAVGCHWPPTSHLSRPALLRPRILLLAWCNPSDYPVEAAQQKIQGWIPEILQLPAGFHRPKCYAPRNTNQFRALGPNLLVIQLCHPSPPLQLVGQIQLCVYYLAVKPWAIP